MNLTRFLLKNKSDLSLKTSIRFEDRVLSYQDLSQQTGRSAAALQELGISKDTLRRKISQYTIVPPPGIQI